MSHLDNLAPIDHSREVWCHRASVTERLLITFLERRGSPKMEEVLRSSDATLALVQSDIA